MFWSIKKRAYRANQQVMKAVSSVLPFSQPVVLSGAGSVEKLAENIRIRGLEHVLVVTDAVLLELGLVDGLRTALDDNGVRYTVFSEVQPNPTIENVESGRSVYKDNACDGIVGFGGGSPMDCAKIIAARIGNPMMSVRMMRGLFRVILPIPPLFCVPTTAGTGSETTIVGVITDAETHEKFAITDLKLMPKIAVLNPTLMVGLPPHITAATGMDALTHAVEAYIGRNGSSYTDEKALEATRLVFSALERAYQNGSDLEARNDMALASFYGGCAFTRAYVGYVHAIAHNMGGLYGVPHGLANAIILPYVLDYSRHDAQAKLAELARAAGLGDAGSSEEQLSAAFIEQVKQMNERMDIPTSIAQLREEDIPLIAQRALAEAHPDYPVPTIMSRGQCEQLIRKLLP
jgi:alcohol dehydrogenase class IV